MDGLAAEAAWASARELGPFVAYDPRPGEAPSASTRLRYLIDGEALHLYIECDLAEGQRLKASLRRRDSLGDDDQIRIYVDAEGQRSRAHMVALNARNIQQDALSNADGFLDFAWDARWQSAALRTEQGWQAELSLPWKALYHPEEIDRLLILVERSTSSMRESSSWPAQPPDVRGFTVLFAELPGPGPVPTSPRLTFTPEATFALDDQGLATTPLGSVGFNAGLTAVWAPTSAASLAATVNPDYSQLEGDAARIEINRRYALYDAERRPFFLDGRDLYSTPGFNLVYTRSMGEPLVGLRGLFSQGPWSGAALQVVDTAPQASVSEGGGWSSEQLKGRSAVETVTRVQRSLGDDGHIGLFLSDRTVLDSPYSNQVAGIDHRLRLGEGALWINGLYGSLTAFGPEDRRAAPAAVSALQWTDGHWSFALEGSSTHKDFRAENGFVTQADSHGFWTEGGRRIDTPWAAVPSFYPLPLDLYASWTGAGQLRELVYEPDISWQGGRGGYAYVEYQLIRELYAGQTFDYQRAEGATRLVLGNPVSINFFASLGQGLLYAAQPDLGRRDSYSISPQARPLPWLALSSALSWERFTRSDGGVEYQGLAARYRLDLSATRSLSARAIVDQSTFDDSLYTQSLLAWEPAPRRALFVGGGFGEESWQAFTKLAWQLGG